MIVSGIVKSSFVDFPGVISCVLFLPGCNYDCYYCHNRGLLEKSPETISLTEIFDFLKKRKGQLDGVTVTGGEPTLQPDLIPFLKEIKALGFKLKLDTNGSRPEILKEILSLSLCDYFAVDYKAPKDRYHEICGNAADADAVLQSISLLQNSGIPFEVRTTVVPELTAIDLLQMAKELPPLSRYVLNKYRKPEKFPEKYRKKVEKQPYTPKKLKELSERIKTVQPNIANGFIIYH